MLSSFAIGLLVVTTWLSACGARPAGSSQLQKAWDGAEQPGLIAGGYETRFYSLPTQAELQRKPWSDTYWPNNYGGIAYRWNDPNRTDAFNDRLYSADELRRMSWEQLSRLSPAEKHDIVNGRFDYPTVAAERRRNNSNAPSWNGLCHGVAPAAVNFAEPIAVDVINSTVGLRIPFGSSDIKALLAYMQSQSGNSRMTGRRCNFDLRKEPWHANDLECRGLNAGTFHLVLANQIGMRQRSFVADLPRGGEIWNHAVFGYSSQVTWQSNNVYPGAAAGTTQVIAVRTHIRTIASTRASFHPQPFWQHPEQDQGADYEYILELGRSGEILGGEWKSFDRPAFFWTQEPAKFTGNFTNLGLMYQAALQ